MREKLYMKLKKRNNLITAVLTGKGGSKLKDKNVLNFFGKPLLSYPCKAAKKVKLINNFFVSSENKKILKTANKYGYTKIVRPSKLSKKNSLHKDVLIHVLQELKKKKIFPEILIVLLANSATIKTAWITKAIKLILKNPSATACVPVVENNDHHPFRAKKLENKYLKSFFKFKKKISSNRQDLENCYFLCHNFWVIRTQAIIDNKGLNPWNFMGPKVLPYLVPHSHDIHTEFDLKICKLLLEKN